MKNTILLNSGKYFDYADIDNQTIDIEDIAQGLSNSCRFGGQCDNFYSIAEHCIWISLKVSAKNALAALLHDATESVMTDIPKPFKVLLKDYGDYELRLEVALAKQYGITFPYDPEIKEADKRMLITERGQLFKNYEDKDKWVWDNVKPFDDLKLGFFEPKIAKGLFLQRFKQLKGK